MESITLPKRRSFTYLIVIPIWFYAIILGLIETNTSIGVIITLVIFLIPSLFFIYIFLFNIFGKEVVSLINNNLVISKKLFFYLSKKEYNICDLESFEYCDQEKLGFLKRSKFNEMGISSGNIKFRFEDLDKYFGIRLYDFEAKPIIEKLNLQLLESKREKCV